MPIVTIYSKSDCHLCDIAKERVDRVRSRLSFDLDIVDITHDEDLMTRYGERIPVIDIDGEELFAFRVNEKVLARRLEASGAQPTDWRGQFRKGSQDG
jgi:glutaredoxin